MADFDGQFVNLIAYDSQTSDTDTYGSLIFPLTLVDETYYQQRIYDSAAGWCYYVMDRIYATPSVGQTVPPHTNNLVAGTHQLLGTRSS